MRFDVWASDFYQIAFSDVHLANRSSFPMRKKQIYRACKKSSKCRDERMLLLSSAAKRRVGCAALRVGSKRPGQGLRPLVWRRRDVPSALESTCLGILCFTTWPTAPATATLQHCSLQVRIHGMVRAKCAALGL